MKKEMVRKPPRERIQVENESPGRVWTLWNQLQYRLWHKQTSRTDANQRPAKVFGLDQLQRALKIRSLFLQIVSFRGLKG